MVGWASMETGAGLEEVGRGLKGGGVSGRSWGLKEER